MADAFSRGTHGLPLTHKQLYNSKLAEYMSN